MNELTRTLWSAVALVALAIPAGCDRSEDTRAGDLFTSALSFADGCRMDYGTCVDEGAERSVCGHAFADCVQAVRPAGPPESDRAEHGLSVCALALEMCIRGDTADQADCRDGFVACVGHPGDVPPDLPDGDHPDDVSACLAAWEMCEADPEAERGECQEMFRACMSAAWGRPDGAAGGATP